MRTGFIHDARFMEHDTGPGHPECSARLSESINYINQQDWYDKLVQINAVEADLTHIAALHDNAYIRRAEEVCRAGNSFLDSMDVSVCTESYDIALLAAGSALQLADEVVNGNINNGFAMLRPPGHHAENSMALGFCLFNNIAILARYLQNTHGMNKVAIIDWDVHHGNGTQHLFEEDPSVLYISTHQYPFYPGTGGYSETGIGRGEGATLNCPMPAGAGPIEYEKAFSEQILPKLDAFKPDIILISAGFDAHQADPLADVHLDERDYCWLTQELKRLADHCCEGKIVSSLEGGYDLNALSRSVYQHVRVLADMD